jgi:hypothetical protein
LLAAIPRLVLGVSQFIHYDGYWHIFISRIDHIGKDANWRLFKEELRADAHPPLSYVILRFVSRFGSSHLVYRSTVIIPGLGAIYVIGLIAARLCRSRVLALLTASAYGFAICMIDLTCDVRSYPLGLFFILAAFYQFLTILEEQTAGISRKSTALWFSSFSILAIWTEYYSLFFVAACIGVVLVNGTAYKAYRERVFAWIQQNWGTICGSIGLTALMITVLYEQHFIFQPRTLDNVTVYYWNPNQQSAGKFLLTNLLADFNYFSPIAVSSPYVVVLAGLLLVSIVVFFSSHGRSPRERLYVLRPLSS